MWTREIWFTFTVIFVRISIFSIETLVHFYISGHKLPQFGVTNRWKTIKKTSSGLIRKFTTKKSNSLWELFFFRKIYIFLFFFGLLRENSPFILQFRYWQTSFTVQWCPINRKLAFKERLILFLASALSVSSLYWNFDFLLRIVLNFWSHMAETSWLKVQ